MKKYRKIRSNHRRASRSNCFFSLSATRLSFILLLLPATATALGLNCSVSAAGVAFGNYNPTDSSPTDATGNVHVRCTTIISVLSTTNISLNTGGSGSFAPRKLSSGANRLNYNLYKEVGKTTVWGDGTGGTGNWTDSLLIEVLGTNINHTIYGSIPAGQYVAAGSYTDTITVTVEFHEGL